MALIHIQEEEKSLDSELVNGTIEHGDLAVREAGGGMHPVDPATDSRFDGIVPNVLIGDHIAEHDEDYRGVDGFTWDGDGTISGSDRAPLQPKAVSSVIIPWTIADNGTDPAPSISENNEVGVAKLASDGTIGIVEAGYTDNGGTQYGNGGTGDYLAVGRAQNIGHGETLTDYESLVEVRLDSDI